MAPVRFGLATKLFAVLLLVGAVGILLTGVLGYVRARDALQATIYNQLTAARQTKSRQVENYFRVIGNELRLLGSTTMVLDAARGFAGFTWKLIHQPHIPERVGAIIRERDRIDDQIAQIIGTFDRLVRKLNRYIGMRSRG